MNQNLDFEQRLRAWLDEDGPQDVPDRVVEVALEEAASAHRRRPLPRVVLPFLDGLESLGAARQTTMARTWLTLTVFMLLLAASVILAGAFLFQVDRLNSNGPIAYDVAGDIWVVEGTPESEPSKLTDTLEIIEGNPVWSPDGRYLAYWATFIEDDHSEIHVFDVDTGRRISLREQDALLLPLEDAIFGWSPDSKQIAAPARATSSDGLQVGMEAVVLFDLETGTPTQVPAKSARWSFGWSPDGRYLGLVGPDDLYVYEFATGAVIPVRGERTAGGTGGPYQLRNIPPVFSSDSRSVIFTDQDAGGGAGGDVRAHTIGELNDTLVVVGPANELGAVVSGDGKQLVYGRSSAVTIDGALKIASDDGRGATFPSELLVTSADGGAPSIVASDVWPRADWSPDGRRLVTRSFEGELVIIDLDRPATVIRIPMHDAVGGYSWAPGGRHPPTSLVP